MGLRILLICTFAGIALAMAIAAAALWLLGDAGSAPLWLVVKGVDVEQWEKRALEAA